MHDDQAQAIVDGIRALQILLRDGDPQCSCAVCAVLRASIDAAR